ncbi:DUF2029 domain-containing protein [bacterium]|nr:DUF2029 domain-containing protein [bacterium]
MFWTNRRIRNVVLILATLLYFRLGVEIFADSSKHKTFFLGDFPAFYISGQLLDYPVAERYQLKLQRILENNRFPSLKGNYFYVAYPPYALLLYSPLAWASPQISRIIYALLVLVAGLVAAYLLSTLASDKLEKQIIFLATITFPSFLFSLHTGQNSIMLLLAALMTWRLLTGQREALAGVTLAVFWIKPHYALMLLVVMGLLRFWKTLVIFLTAGVFCYAIGYFLSDGEWLIDWLKMTQWFYLDNLMRSSHVIISLPMALDYFSTLGFPAQKPLNLVLWLFYLYCLGLISYNLYQSSSAELEVRAEQFLLVVALLSFFAPYAMYYDFVLILPALVILGREERGNKFLIYCYALAYLALLEIHFIFSASPAVPLLAGVNFAAAVWIIQKRFTINSRELA